MIIFIGPTLIYSVSDIATIWILWYKPTQYAKYIKIIAGAVCLMAILVWYFFKKTVNRWHSQVMGTVKFMSFYNIVIYCAAVLLNKHNKTIRMMLIVLLVVNIAMKLATIPLIDKFSKNLEIQLPFQ